jgi:hypothetical protein
VRKEEIDLQPWFGGQKEKIHKLVDAFNALEVEAQALRERVIIMSAVEEELRAEVKALREQLSLVRTQA